jgi:triphosphoribosyl-dephospho-CoA synthase
MKSDKQSFSDIAAKVAVRSLIEEVELTPKPGLVDQVNTGAHQDLTLQLMIKSAETLTVTFKNIAFVSYGRIPSQALREEIAAIGRNGEKKMFEATGGVNTHKGAIWAIGLLVSAASIGKGMYTIKEIVKRAGEIASFPDRYCPNTNSNGRIVTSKYGVGGARGEAQQGFPHIIKFSLPMLYRSRAYGLTEEKARLKTLLSLIAHVDDTCILKQAAYFLTKDNLECINTLDEEFIRRNISPGGSADLLAATFFLDKIHAFKAVDEVQKEYELIK